MTPLLPLCDRERHRTGRCAAIDAIHDHYRAELAAKDAVIVSLGEKLAVCAEELAKVAEKREG